MTSKEGGPGRVVVVVRGGASCCCGGAGRGVAWSGACVAGACFSFLHALQRTDAAQAEAEAETYILRTLYIPKTVITSRESRGCFYRALLPSPLFFSLLLLPFLFLPCLARFPRRPRPKMDRRGMPCHPRWTNPWVRRIHLI
ncbi:hypothetical protein LX36DRAFT_34321 [Colletotrichum falcatum]|nr:hypothetical protein LX36DRAFT_34321 [Colletotrichum falcatum]